MTDQNFNRLVRLLALEEENEALRSKLRRRLCTCGADVMEDDPCILCGDGEDATLER